MSLFANLPESILRCGPSSLADTAMIRSVQGRVVLWRHEDCEVKSSHDLYRSHRLAFGESSTRAGIGSGGYDLRYRPGCRGHSHLTTVTAGGIRRAYHDWIAGRIATVNVWNEVANGDADYCADS